MRSGNCPKKVAGRVKRGKVNGCDRYYRGNLHSADAVKAIFKTARDFIDKVK